MITHQVLRDWDFELLELFHEIADRLFNPRLPILQNTDGELLSLQKLPSKICSIFQKENPKVRRVKLGLFMH